MFDSQGGPGIRGSRGDRGEPGLTVKYTYASTVSHMQGHPELSNLSPNRQQLKMYTMHVPPCCFWKLRVSKSRSFALVFSKSLLCLFVSLHPAVVSSTVISLQMCVSMHRMHHALVQIKPCWGRHNFISRSKVLCRLGLNDHR